MSQKRKSPSSSRRVATLALAKLSQLADPRVAEQGQTFFKKDDAVPLYGVKAPAVRQLVRETHDSVKHSWDLADAVEFCNAMVRHPELEAKLVGLLLLGRFHQRFEPGVANAVESWLAEGWLASWAAVDGLCAAVTSPLVRVHSHMVESITQWATSTGPWLRRAAVVTFVPFARRGAYLAEAYGLADRLAGDAEDLIHKACGWLLREAGKTDPERLAHFLEHRGHRLPRTTVRYAIERFETADRRRLLEVTRPDGARRRR